MSRPTTAMFFDPSFTGTGWVAVDLLTELPIGAGVISTRPPPPAERRHLTQAAMDGRRGVHIRQRVTLLLEHYQPVVVGQEGNAGSQSAKAAAALARAQQAVLDAIDGYLGGGEPIWVTVQAAKKAACGKLNATKEEVEAAMRQRWPADWDALLNTPDPSGIGTRPRSEWENAFDAASVAAAAWPHPSVAMARTMAQRAAPDTWAT